MAGHITTHAPTRWAFMAEYAEADQLLVAARRARAAGYTQLDAFTPFPVPGLAEALGLRPTRLPMVVLIAGLLGACAGYLLQWYPSVIDYPWNVGGRPLHSWPAFVPITFESMVLCAASTAALAMILANGLPRLHHPVFDAPHFRRASTDRFFLAILDGDSAPNDPQTTRDFLRSTGSLRVSEVFT